MIWDNYRHALELLIDSTGPAFVEALEWWEFNSSQVAWWNLSNLEAVTAQNRGGGFASLDLSWYYDHSRQRALWSLVRLALSPQFRIIKCMSNWSNRITRAASLWDSILLSRVYEGQKTNFVVW